jgi:RNA polymerase sigma factor (sigma-70 family)
VIAGSVANLTVRVPARLLKAAPGFCASQDLYEKLSANRAASRGFDQNGGWLDRVSFMRACRDGAAIEQALRELDRDYFAVLYRDGLRTLHDPEAARDLVQETFIKVWRRCATFRGDSELLSWIKVILRNGAFERLRQTTREVPLEDGEDLTAEVSRRLLELSIDGNATPEQALRRQQLADTFRRGWQRFRQADPLHANVMAWVIEDGLSIEEVAQLLGRTPGATREFVSQCRKHARVHLAEWYAAAHES